MEDKRAEMGICNMENDVNDDAVNGDKKDLWRVLKRTRRDRRERSTKESLVVSSRFGILREEGKLTKRLGLVTAQNTGQGEMEKKLEEVVWRNK